MDSSVQPTTLKSIPKSTPGRNQVGATKHPSNAGAVNKLPAAGEAKSQLRDPDADHQNSTSLDSDSPVANASTRCRQVKKTYYSRFKALARYWGQNAAVERRIPPDRLPKDASYSPLLPPFRPPSNSSSQPQILGRIETPYKIQGFKGFFDRHQDLHRRYPALLEKLVNGFPMGVFPDLPRTVIFPNEHLDDKLLLFVDSYFKEEVDSHRMSGPFSRLQVERIFGGPFYCAPLSIDQPKQQGAAPPKLRLCINLSREDKHKGISSVNSYCDIKDFPTSYDGADRVARIVGLFLIQ